jgi:hypothetical protein
MNRSGWGYARIVTGSPKRRTKKMTTIEKLKYYDPAQIEPKIVADAMRDALTELEAIETAIQSETHGLFMVRERDGWTIHQPRNGRTVTEPTLAEAVRLWNQRNEK